MNLLKNIDKTKLIRLKKHLDYIVAHQNEFERFFNRRILSCKRRRNESHVQARRRPRRTAATTRPRSSGTCRGVSSPGRAPSSTSVEFEKSFVRDACAGPTHRDPPYGWQKSPDRPRLPTRSKSHLGQHAHARALQAVVPLHAGDLARNVDVVVRVAGVVFGKDAVDDDGFLI